LREVPRPGMVPFTAPATDRGAAHGAPVAFRPGVGPGIRLLQGAVATVRASGPRPWSAAVVWGGRGLGQPSPEGPLPEFALYLLGDTPPLVAGEARWVRWPDFSLPTDRYDAQDA